MPCAKKEKEKKGGWGAEFKVRPLSAVLNLSITVSLLLLFWKM